MSGDELEPAVATSTLTAPTSSAGVVATPVSGSLLVSSSDDADTIMKIVTRTVVGVPPVPDVGPTSTSSNPVVNIKTKSTILKLYKLDVLRLYDITDFAERLKIITKAWRSVVVLLESTTTEACDNVMYLALRHTLHTMLMGKWSTISAQDRDYIRKQIELCIPLVEKCSSNSLYRCQYVLTQLDDPWGHPILQQLMGNNDDDETDEDSPGIVQSQSGVPFKRFADGTDESHPLASAICEEITFLAREKACMIALRLQKLCECRIYDQACSLAGRMIRALRTCSPKDSLRKNTSVSQEGYIFDIYLVLLYYLGRTEEFMAEIRALDLNNALFLCSRNPPHPHQLVTRLKPYYNQVIEKALQVFMAQFLSSKLSAGQDVYLRGLCVHWVIRNQSHEDYQTRLRHLVTLCTGYQNFYILLDALTQLFPDRNDHKWDKLEMLCRGMTRELNELEQMKTDHSIGAQRILASEQQIAPRFLTLADVFEDFPELARELTLTSFSLQPTDIVFQKIQAFAINSANVLNGLSNIQSSQAAALLLECPIHDELAAGDTATPSSLCSGCGVRVQSAIVRTEIDRMEYVQRVGALHSVTGNRFSDIYSYDATSAPNLILDAIKTLSFEYRQDLLTLISAPRIKNLSWLMEWPELHQNCLDLLRTSAKIARIEHTVATANDHLDFLYPDFERYRNMKPHQYPGIENGYEMFYRDADNGDDDAAATEQSNCGIHDEDTSSASEAELELSALNAKEKKAAQLAERRKRHYANRAKIDPTTTKVPKVKMAEGTRRKTRPHSRKIDPALRRPRGRPILYREDGLPASATRLKKLQSTRRRNATAIMANHGATETSHQPDRLGLDSGFMHQPLFIKEEDMKSDSNEDDKPTENDMLIEAELMATNELLIKINQQYDQSVEFLLPRYDRFISETCTKPPLSTSTSSHVDISVQTVVKEMSIQNVQIDSNQISSSPLDVDSVVLDGSAESRSESSDDNKTNSEIKQDDSVASTPDSHTEDTSLQDHNQTTPPMNLVTKRIAQIPAIVTVDSLVSSNSGTYADVQEYSVATKKTPSIYRKRASQPTKRFLVESCPMETKRSKRTRNSTIKSNLSISEITISRFNDSTKQLAISDQSLGNAKWSTQMNDSGSKAFPKNGRILDSDNSARDLFKATESDSESKIGKFSKSKISISVVDRTPKPIDDNNMNPPVKSDNSVENDEMNDKFTSDRTESLTDAIAAQTDSDSHGDEKSQSLVLLPSDENEGKQLKSQAVEDIKMHEEPNLTETQHDNRKPDVKEAYELKTIEWSIKSEPQLHVEPPTTFSDVITQQELKNPVFSENQNHLTANLAIIDTDSNISILVENLENHKQVFVTDAEEVHCDSHVDHIKTPETEKVKLLKNVDSAVDDLEMNVHMIADSNNKTKSSLRSGLFLNHASSKAILEYVPYNGKNITYTEETNHELASVDIAVDISCKDLPSHTTTTDQHSTIEIARHLKDSSIDDESSTSTPSSGPSKESQLFSSFVKLTRLSDEFIGWRLNSTQHCPNNRLLQSPRVMLRRIKQRRRSHHDPVVVLSNSENNLDDSSLQLPADIIHYISSDDDVRSDGEVDQSLPYIKPEYFAPPDPEEDPLFLGDQLEVAEIEQVCQHNEQGLRFRYSAAIMHGMGTKHLDQMAQQMAPATYFTSELNEDDGDGAHEHDEIECVGDVVVDLVPDLLKSCTGTEDEIEYDTDEKFTRMTMSSLSQSSIVSSSGQSTSLLKADDISDDESVDSKTRLPDKRRSPYNEEEVQLNNHRRHKDDDQNGDDGGRGSGGGGTAGSSISNNSGGGSGGTTTSGSSGIRNGSSSAGGGNRSRPHRGSSSGTTSVTSKGTTASGVVQYRPKSTKRSKPQGTKRNRSRSVTNLTVWMQVQSNSSPKNQHPHMASRAGHLHTNRKRSSMDTTPSVTEEPPTVRRRTRHARRPGYLVDYSHILPSGNLDKGVGQASGGARNMHLTTEKDRFTSCLKITIQQLRNAISRAFNTIPSASDHFHAAMKNRPASTAGSDSTMLRITPPSYEATRRLLVDLIDIEQFQPPIETDTIIVNIVQLKKSSSTTKETTTSVNSANAASSSGNTNARQSIVSASTSAPPSTHDKPIMLPSLSTPSTSSPQHLLQILNAPPSRNLSKTNFTATATNGNILAASSSSSSSSLSAELLAGVSSGNINLSSGQNNVYLCKTDGKTFQLSPIQNSCHGRGGSIRVSSRSRNNRCGGGMVFTGKQTRTTVNTQLLSKSHQTQPNDDNVLIVSSSSSTSVATATTSVLLDNGHCVPEYTQSFAFTENHHQLLLAASPMDSELSTELTECLVTAAAAQPVIILDSESSNCDLSDATSIVLKEPSSSSDDTTSHVYYARKPIIAFDTPPPLHRNQSQTMVHHTHSAVSLVRSNEPHHPQPAKIKPGTGHSRVNENRIVTVPRSRCVKHVSPSASSHSSANMDQPKITTSPAVPRMTVRPLAQFRPLLRHLLVTDGASPQPQQQPSSAPWPRVSNVVVRHQPPSPRNNETTVTNTAVRAETVTTKQRSATVGVGVDTSTLEQLREFDAVLEQVKERSHSTPTQPSVVVATTLVTTEAVNSVIRTAITNPSMLRTQTFQPHAHPPQQQQLSQGMSNIMYKTASGQMVNLSFLPLTSGQPNIVLEQTSVVVVHSKPSASSQAPPSVNLAKQNSSSLLSASKRKHHHEVPTVFTSPISPNTSTKSTMSHTTTHIPNKTASPHASTTQPPGQQKPQEDEKTVQRIYDILAEYAEQLRNSPDLNNKPAPRRRSNPPTNLSTGCGLTSLLSPSATTSTVSTITSSIGSGAKKRKHSGVHMKSSQPHRSFVSHLAPATTNQHVTPVPKTSTSSSIDSDDSHCPTTWLSVLDERASSPPSLFTQSDPPSIVQTALARPIASARRQIIYANPPTTESASSRNTEQRPDQSSSIPPTTRNFLLDDPNSMATICPTPAATTNTVVMPGGNYVLPMGVTRKPGQQIAIHASSAEDGAQLHQTSSGQCGRIVLKSFIKQPKKIQRIGGCSADNFIVDVKDSTEDSKQNSSPNAARHHYQVEDENPPPQKVHISGSAFARVPQQQQTSSAYDDMIAATATSQMKMLHQIQSRGIIREVKTNSSGIVSIIDDSECETQQQQHIFEHDLLVVKDEEMPIVMLNDLESDHQNGDQYINEPASVVVHAEHDDESDFGPDEPKIRLFRFGTSTSPSIDPDLSHRNSKFCMMGNPSEHSLSTQYLLDDSSSSAHHHHSSHGRGSTSSDIGRSGGRGSGQTLMLHSDAHSQSGSGHLTIQERRRVAIEREILLQKSLSEECEDLGVDEPSTSDLFPEAELPFDTGSPPFDLDMETNSLTPRGVGGTIVAAEVTNKQPRIFFGVTKRKTSKRGAASSSPGLLRRFSSGRTHH